MQSLLCELHSVWVSAAQLAGPLPTLHELVDESQLHEVSKAAQVVDVVWSMQASRRQRPSSVPHTQPVVLEQVEVVVIPQQKSYGSRRTTGKA